MQLDLRRPLHLFAALALAGAGTFCGCVAVDLHHDLDFERTVVLDAGDRAAGGLTVTIPVGDIEVVATGGPARLVADVHEDAPGVARVELVDGRLVLETAGGDARLGDVRIEIDAVFGDLVLETGVGDVRVEHVDAHGEVRVSVGTGDVVLRDLGRPSSVIVEGGVGDTRLSALDAGSVDVDRGGGDVDLDDVSTDRAHLSTGVGDVQVDGCLIDALETSTGIGDVGLADSRIRSRRLEIGLGSLRD